MDNDKGYVYILGNPSFECYTKLGTISSIEQLQQDITELSTATPFAYNIYAHYKVDKKLQVVENALHYLIDKIHYQLRVYDDKDSLELRMRGFVPLSNQEVLQALQEIVTLRGDFDNLVVQSQSANDQKIAQKFKTQRQLQKTLPLSQYGLKAGDKIYFLRDNFYKATVQDDNTVLYNGTPYTLDDLAKYLTKKHYNWHTDLTVTGSHFFAYDNKPLVELAK